MSKAHLHDAGWLTKAVTKDLIAKGVLPPTVTTAFDGTEVEDGIAAGDFVVVSPDGYLSKAEPGDSPVGVAVTVSGEKVSVMPLTPGLYPPVGGHKKPKKLPDKNWLTPEQMKEIVKSHT